MVSWVFGGLKCYFHIYQLFSDAFSIPTRSLQVFHHLTGAALFPEKSGGEDMTDHRLLFMALAFSGDRITERFAKQCCRWTAYLTPSCTTTTQNRAASLFTLLHR
jgi:hypothetical protein